MKYTFDEVVFCLMLNVANTQYECRLSDAPSEVQTIKRVASHMEQAGLNADNVNEIVAHCEKRKTTMEKKAKKFSRAPTESYQRRRQ